MQEYKSNSFKSREESKTEVAAEKKVQKVVSGAKTRQNNTRKLTDIFISEDAANVKSYIFMDVLVPAIKKAISDIVTDGIDMILYGGASGRRSSGRRSESKVSYRSYYDDKRDRRDDSYSARSRFDYDDIVFRSRGDAEAVREQMEDMIDRYGVVTVADMYDMAELSAPYTSNKYGWTNIRSAEAVRIRDGGYILKLPKAMPID